MEKKTVNLKQRIKGVPAIIFFVAGICTMLFFQSVFASSMGDYGKIQQDIALKNIVKQKQTLPDYKYYYIGRSHLPYAVIGIDPGYKLTSKHWYEIESKDQVENKVVHLMYADTMDTTFGRILDPVGNKIGVWFSEYKSTIVKFLPDNEIMIFSPYTPNDSL